MNVFPIPARMEELVMIKTIVMCVYVQRDFWEIIATLTWLYAQQVCVD